MNKKYKCEKILWKEAVKGVLIAIFWCTLAFVFMHEASDTLITVLEAIPEKENLFWEIYIIVLMLSIIAGIIIKVGMFLIFAPEEQNKKAKKNKTKK